VALFAFKKTDSFPVDTWIEKVYFEDFNGKLLQLGAQIEKVATEKEIVKFKLKVS